MNLKLAESQQSRQQQQNLSGLPLPVHSCWPASKALPWRLDSTCTLTSLPYESFIQPPCRSRKCNCSSIREGLYLEALHDELAYPASTHHAHALVLQIVRLAVHIRSCAAAMQCPMLALDSRWCNNGSCMPTMGPNHKH